ncbi:MAG: hypothetical protein IM638_06840 [Bacteroidetes bacterium]|nr:hypothetical protein [Bacteroidota bacterium]
MSLRFFSLLCGLLAFSCLYSQQADFPLMYSHGKIPRKFLIKPEAAAKEEIDAIKAQSKRLTQAEVDYIYIREYTFSHYITEGIITYGDEISNFSQRIVNRLLVNDPELNKKINVYLLRSYEARLVSFDNGIIFVSTGLFSKIENEAQLAYLLAREIIHIRENHARENYLNTYSGESRNIRYQDRVSVFSAEQEAVTDKKAIRLFIDAGYAMEESVKSLTLLSSFDQCFGNIKFDISFFEHDDYIFPLNYQLQELVLAPADSLAMQLFPNLSNRINDLKSYIQLLQQAEGKSAFENISQLQVWAREETIRMYCIDQKINHSIYGAYVILQTDSQNKAARRTIAYCLAIKAIYESPDHATYSTNVIVLEKNAAFKDYSKKSTGNKDEEVAEKVTQAGEAQRVNHFLTSMSHPELTILALDHNWGLYHQYATETDALKRVKMLMNILKANYDLGLMEFSHTAYQPVLNEKSAPENLTQNPLPKPTGKPIITLEPLQAKDAWGTYKETQDNNLEQKMQGYSINDPNGEKDKTSKIIPPVKAVTWRKADPEKQYESVIYNYYEYAFVSYIHDAEFIKAFNRSADKITMEKTYRDFTPYVVYEMKHNSGLGKDKFIPGYIYGLERQYNSRLEQLTINNDGSEEVRKYQKDAVFSYSDNYANAAFYSVHNLTENDTFAYSYYCIYQTILSDLYNHLKEDRYIAPDICGVLRNNVTIFFKTNIILSSYVINQSQSDGRSASRITTTGIDMDTGRIVLYWYEENSMLAKSYLLNTHYSNIRKKISYQPK